jgi:glycosyltransferase involved in cell wall biosynthesis
VNFNKGVHRLIEAFAGSALPESELIITGRGSAPGWPRFQQMARGHRVTFQPPVAQAALPDLFASCDVFVLASLADGFGLTVLQAMACELPVIVTSRCGCAEVLAGCHAAEIIPPGDTEALAAGLRRAYEARDAERGRTARAWAVRLDWDAHARQLVTALQTQEIPIAS